MASRPVFLPRSANACGVDAKLIEFCWHPGLSRSQKRKSISELHGAAIRMGACSHPLEISSQSESELGVALSAFNLAITVEPGLTVSVESVFQSSKCFFSGGPFQDLLKSTAREVKRDERLRNSGRLRCFSFAGREWPLNPTTAFYDWLYISALQESELGDRLLDYDGFTDIEFNPSKSLNCQAHAAALFVAMKKAGRIFRVRDNPDRFLEIVKHS